MTQEQFMTWLRGSVQSWTMWFGAIVVTVPDWWPLISDDAAQIFGEGYAAMVTRVVGVLVIALRIKTVASIAAKGGKT